MGYVYFIGSTLFGWYKIGKSITPEVRVRDLGILLPFKIEILAVWKAENHHKMETVLHEMFKDNRINGEWFEFTKKQAFKIIDETIPTETRVEVLSTFANLLQDSRGEKKILGLKVQKLRGNFTQEERDARRDASIILQKQKKQEKADTINRIASSDA